MIVTVYTDGSADNSAKSKIGGYGVVFVATINGKKRMKKHSSPKYLDTNSIRMEMKGILYALKRVEVGHKIDIHTDSEFCVKAINEWIPNWLTKNTLRDKKNSEIWIEIIKHIKKHKNGGSSLKFVWIRGHNGNQLNEMADELANIARCRQGTGISCKANN